MHGRGLVRQEFHRGNNLNRGKMRGSLKAIGRCSVPGHGQWCVVTHEIRESVMCRAAEKRAWKREVQ